MNKFRVLIFSYITFSCLFIFVSNEIPITGDEHYYYNSSKRALNVIESVLQFDYVSFNRNMDDLLANGMFIPASSFLCSPLRLITNDVFWFRFLLFLVNLFLSVYIIHQLSLKVGFKSAALYALLSIITPIYTIFSFTFWGESIAGKLLLLLVLMILDYESKKLDRRYFLKLGMIFSLIFLFRQSFLLVIPTVFVFFFWLDRFSLRNIKKWLISLSIVLSVVGTWSYQVSKKFGGFYLTTTSVHTSPILNFSSNEYKKRNKISSEKKRWGRLNRLIHRKMAMEGKSYYDVASNEKKKVMEELNMNTYLALVSKNLKMLYKPTSVFTDRYGSGHPDKVIETTFWVLGKLFMVMWFVILILSIYSLIVIYEDNSINMMALISGAFVLLCSVQVFLAGTHSRHFYGFLPVMILMSTLSLSKKKLGFILFKGQSDIMITLSRCLVIMGVLFFCFLVVVF